MDERLDRVVGNIRNNESFVCNPAKDALAKGTLLIGSFNPQGISLAEEVQVMMQTLFTDRTMEGALMVSMEDPDPDQGVLGLLPTIASITMAVQGAVRKISGLHDAEPWERLLKGHCIGEASMRWEDASLAGRTSRDGVPISNIDEGIFATVHGPAYPSTHPRYQPHPSLALVRLSVLYQISRAASLAVLRRADVGSGREAYPSTTFLLSLNSNE